MLPGGTLSTTPIMAPWINPYWRPRLNPLIDYDRGGVGLNDPSLGLDYQEWKCWYDQDAETIYVAPKAGGTPVAILTSLANVEEVTITFDQNMRPTIAYKQAGVVKLYWYDTSLPGVTTTSYTSAISAIARLDDRRDSQSSNSDIIFVTIEGGYICYRLQRERYETLHQLKATTATGLSQCGMNKNWRFQIQTVDDHPECAMVDGQVSAACIVADQCSRVGVSAETGDLYETFMPGYIVNTQSSARSNIEPLQAIFSFDAFEFDEQIWFRHRGRPPLVIYDDLEVAASSDGENVKDTMTIQRTQETELARTVNLGYFDLDREHEPSIQSASRQTVNSYNELTVNANIVLTADGAIKNVQKMLRIAWLNREVVKFTLPISEIALNPTDSVVIVADSIANLIRITGIRYQLAGVMECEGVVESLEGEEAFVEYSGWTSSATGIVGDFIPSAPPETPTPITGYWLDTNLVSDYHDEGGVYITAKTSGYWRGAYVYASRDGGITYQFLTSIQQQAKIGVANTALAAPIHHGIVDHGRTVRITIPTTQDLSSIGHTTALSHMLNMALLGNEIICFENVELISPGVYDLTGLHRGLRGTEWAMGTHVIGEQFIVLNNSVVRVPFADYDIGTKVLIKYLAYGQSLDQVSATEKSYLGSAFEPYAPSNLIAADAGGGSWDITWTRRTRLDGDWRDYVDAALSEVEEKYKVQVYNGVNLVSSAEVTTPAATVTASTGYIVKVNQISAVTGDGYVSEVTIP